MIADGSRMDKLPDVIRNWAARRTWTERATTDMWPSSQNAVPNPEAVSTGAGDEEMQRRNFEDAFEKDLEERPVLTREEEGSSQ